MSRSYLKKFNIEETRFLSWFKSMGADLQDVLKVLDEYKKEDKKFDNDYDLCNSILREVQRMEAEKHFGPKPPDFVSPEPKREEIQKVRIEIEKKETLWQKTVRILKTPVF